LSASLDGMNLPDVPVPPEQQPRTTIRWRYPELLERVTEHAEALDRSLNWVIQEAVAFYFDEMDKRGAEGLAEARKRPRGQGRPFRDVFAEMDARRAAGAADVPRAG
jgi:predicted transcriptional regulator